MRPGRFAGAANWYVTGIPIPDPRDDARFVTFGPLGADLSSSRGDSAVDSTDRLRAVPQEIPSVLRVTGLIILIFAGSGCRTTGAPPRASTPERAGAIHTTDRDSTRTATSSVIAASLDVPADDAASQAGAGAVTGASPPVGDGMDDLSGASLLTLAGLEQMALERNPTIQQAAALVQQQEGLTRQAGLYPNPTVGFVQNNASQAGQSQAAGVFLSQEFVTAGKLNLAQRAGRHDLVLRGWQTAAQEMRVRNDLRIRFYEAFGAQQAVLAAEELEQSAADGVQIAEELLEARRGSRPDVLQAEMQLSLARGTLRDARLRLQSAKRHLANVAGIHDLPDGPLTGDFEADVPDLDWDMSLRRLLDESPLLKSQAAELRAAQTEVQLARAQAVPNLTVQVVAQRDYGQNFNSVSSLVALPVPLFNRNQGNIINAEGILVQQQQEYERLRLALSDQLAASFRQYSSLRSDVARTRDEILPRAKENLELTTEAYRLGRLDFLRVVDARRTYFHARMSLIDALTELRKVVVEIEGLQLSGGLNPTEVGTALQTTPGTGGIGGAGARGVLLQQLQQQQNAAPRNLPGAIQAAEP